MGDLHRQPTTPKARKDHICDACNHTIDNGEMHTQQTGFFEGSAYRNRFHFECWDRLDLDSGEGFFPGYLEPPQRLTEV
jgi:hypothetical protein